MPVVMCRYCEYLGQGDNYADKIADVERHEKVCEERPEEDTLQKCAHG